MGLLSRFRAWRAGGVSGQQLTENNVKMTGVLVAPFLGMWVFIRLLIPEVYYDQYVTIAFVAWLGWIVMLYAWSKADLNNYICFPQSKWKFPDGTCKTFDLKIPPDSWEELIHLPDGSVGYKVHFNEKYLYQDPDLPFPDIFDLAYWLLPKTWDICFKRRAFGEMFHKGVFVTKPDCEDISVYVVAWETKEGQRFPVCLVNDCAYTYEKALETYTNPIINQETGVNEADVLYMLYRDGRKREGKLIQHSAYLEDSVEVAMKDSSEDFKKSADERMKAVRKRHARIMDTKAPLLSRIINLKNVAYALLIISVVYLFGHFILGVW